MLIIDIDVIRVEGYSFFGDENKAIWDDWSEGIDDGSAPFEEEHASAGLLAQWPHGFCELTACNMALGRGSNEAENEPKLA